MSYRIAIVVALFVSAGSAGFADPITITPSRSIFGFVSFTEPSGIGASALDGARSSTSGTFNESRVVSAQTELHLLSVTASQNTNFDPRKIRLTGSGSVATDNSIAGISELDMNQAISEVFLGFTLTHATPFRFTGELTGRGDAFVQAKIEGLFNDFAGEGFSPVVVNEHGMLQPGSYLFFTRATVGENIPVPSGNASFDIDFKLGAAATPEPASLSLLAVGLAAAVAVGRRRVCERLPCG